MKMIKNSIYLGLVLSAPCAAFSPSPTHPLTASSALRSSAPEDRDAGIQSFSLAPDQGTGTTMNPFYQIDKGSIYPRGMQKQRAAFATQSAKHSFSQRSSARGAGMTSYSASPDHMMWDGTTGMSRRPIDPESHYPAGMASFSRPSASYSEPNRSLGAAPEASSPPSEPESASSLATSGSEANPAEESKESRPMSREEQVAYAQALKSRAGQNHMMWDGTSGMSRQPINPSSSYPRGMRHGMW